MRISVALSMTFVFVFGTSSCFSVQDNFIVQVPSVKKQKHRMALLQKKLQSYKKEKEGIEKEIEETLQEIGEIRLALIRKKVDSFEEKKEQKSELFAEEREALYDLIQMGPSPQAFAAQVELDRILRMITELGEEKAL